MVRRLHIIGGPGSGKTTLANEAGARLGVPVYDLDQLAYDGGRPVSLNIRLSKAREIAAKEGWVAEGIYLGWTQVLMDSAEAIVWLDVPRRVALWRVLSRHLRRSLARDNPHGGFRRLVRFLKFVGAYYRSADLGGSSDPPAEDASITRSTTEAWLVPYASKTIRLARAREVQRWLAGL